MIDTGQIQEYGKGVQEYAKGVGEFAKGVPDRWSPTLASGVQDYAKGVADFAKGVPDRWSPTLTYQVEVKDQHWWKFLLGGIGIGLTASWFLMPRSGAHNRAALRNRFAHLFKLTARDLPEAAARKTDYMSGKVTGMSYGARKMAHLNGGEEPPDLDQFIAHKVETEVFGRPGIPKGALNVDSVDGVVTVRGTVESREVMQRILKDVEGVDGVRDVVNLMKTPQDMPLPYTDPRR